LSRSTVSAVESAFNSLANTVLSNTRDAGRSRQGNAAADAESWPTTISRIGGAHRQGEIERVSADG